MDKETGICKNCGADIPDDCEYCLYCELGFFKTGCFCNEVKECQRLG
jgi:hypothetical protein